jgi:hypothetical protein
MLRDVQPNIKDVDQSPRVFLWSCIEEPFENVEFVFDQCQKFIGFQFTLKMVVARKNFMHFVAEIHEFELNKTHFKISVHSFREDDAS